MSGAPLVTGETTIAELALILNSRAVTQVKLWTSPVYVVHREGAATEELRAQGSAASDRLRSQHHSSANATGLTLAEALSALLGEIPTVGGDRGQ